MKLNKIYTELITEGKEKYKYGCVMLYLELSKAKQKEIQALVSEEDLYLGPKDEPGYGRETEPHVTILYGIHDDVPDSDVEKLIDELVAPDIMLNKISIFDNADKGFDVVKFDVENKELNKMNKKFKTLPFTSDYPDYHAHVTIAYVKPGEGKKYIHTLDDAISVIPKKIVYSKANGEKKSYKFK